MSGSQFLTLFSHLPLLASGLFLLIALRSMRVDDPPVARLRLAAAVMLLLPEIWVGYIRNLPGGGDATWGYWGSVVFGFRAAGLYAWHLSVAIRERFSPFTSKPLIALAILLLTAWVMLVPETSARVVLFPLALIAVGYAVHAGILSVETRLGSFLFLAAGLATLWIFREGGWRSALYGFALGFAALKEAEDVARERVMIERERLDASTRRVDLLRQVVTTVGTTLELEKVLNQVVEVALVTTNAAAGAVFLEEGGHLQAHAIQGIFPPVLPVSERVTRAVRTIQAHVKAQKIPVGQGFISRGLDGSVLETDPAAFPRTLDGVIALSSFALVPLKSPAERLGVLAVIGKEVKTLERKDLEALETIAEIAVVSVHNARLHGEIIEKKRFEQDLSIAHVIQERLLPQKLPDLEGMETATAYRSAREVGGDYYDLIRRGDSLIAIVADVSGKGIAASLIMAMVRSVLRAQVDAGASPAAILKTANRNVHDDVPRGMFVTAMVAEIRPGKVILANAGHNPALLMTKDGEISEMRPRGPALGFVKNANFVDLEQTLEPGSVVFLYTDGIPEAMSMNSEEFGDDRLKGALKRHRVKPVSETLGGVLSEMESFRRGADPSDDVTAVMIRQSIPGEIARLHLEVRGRLDSLSSVREAVAGYLEKNAVTEETRDQVIMALDEAVNNVIEHVYKEDEGMIEIDLAREKDRVRLQVADRGKIPYNVDEFGHVDMKTHIASRKDGGLGVKLMRTLMDSVWSKPRDGGGTMLVMEKAIPPSAKEATHA